MASTAKSETIVNLVEGLPRLRVYDEEITAFEDKYFVSTLPIADKNTYIGIEVETENVQSWDSHASPYWRITEDGSLRNSGREFISVPIKAFRVENALTVLFNLQTNKDIEFTDRTSVHIHMNVRTMTLEQLQAMVLLYLVFEHSLFRYVHKDRYKNIFCVPLTETSFGENLHNLFHSERLLIGWMKYTALNLCPIFDKGTIEFRHLHGTKDIPEIVNWINLILCLKKTALKNTPEYIWEKVQSLNTSSLYHQFASEVFGDFLPNLNESFLIQDISECITYIKTKCLSNPWREDLYLLKNLSKKFPKADIKTNWFTEPRIAGYHPTGTTWTTNAFNFSEDVLEEAPIQFIPNGVVDPSYEEVIRSFGQDTRERILRNLTTSTVRIDGNGLLNERPRTATEEMLNQPIAATPRRVRNNNF